MAGTGDNEGRGAPAGARDATAAAIELIRVELARSEPNWRTVLVLAARMVEIADRAERGLEPNGGGH